MTVERPPYTVERNVSLRGRNTLRVPARAAWLARVETLDALPDLLGDAVFADLPVLVLGEGSNVLFAADFPGLIVSIAGDRMRILDQDESTVCVNAEAGLSWDALVDATLARGVEGLENLALIPGYVGAAPVQNIGAYGVELAEFVRVVHAFDRRSGGFVALEPGDCRFAYRDSAFKHEPDRWIITAVELLLPRQHELRLDYPGVRAEIVAQGCDRPRATDVAAAIRALRRRKLPDPARIGNAGSFFKNPHVSRARLRELRNDFADIPSFPAGADLVKLAAAWLIEACGLKGLREGDAGISAQHALVLVNHGRASGTELLALARRVVATVESRFGIRLEAEPRIIGGTL
jgi:UDP-N-acetylmuramate dehydrogenase